jgi:hypothetical protein
MTVKSLSLSAALILAALVAVPVFARQAPIAPASPPEASRPVACTGTTTIAGTVLARDVVTVFALPLGAEGNGRKFVALTILEAGGGTSRVLVPWEVLLRGLASAPNLGDAVSLSPGVEVLQGFASPQWIAPGFSVVPQ